MEFVLSKIDAAVDQRDWAIRLLLDHKAYVPAITLAGAAEEILGTAVGAQASFTLLKKSIAADFRQPEKVISQHYLNKAKNWLKHWDNLKDDENLVIELDEEVLHYIIRALANIATHDGSQPSEGPRFWAWMTENRPDLVG